MPRINSRLAADYIRDLKPFSSNGALSAEYRGSDYVVSSYDTAIASVSNNGAAYLNEASYSNTTTRHQAAARLGLRDLNPLKISSPGEFTGLTGHRASTRTR